MTATLKRMGRPAANPDTNTYSGRVAARVRALRLAKKWEVSDLAQRVGISELSLWRYECGQRTISPDLYPDFAAAFGLTVRGFLPPE